MSNLLLNLDYEVLKFFGIFLIINFIFLFLIIRMCFFAFIAKVDPINVVKVIRPSTWKILQIPKKKALQEYKEMTS